MAMLTEWFHLTRPDTQTKESNMVVSLGKLAMYITTGISTTAPARHISSTEYAVYA